MGKEVGEETGGKGDERAEQKEKQEKQQLMDLLKKFNVDKEKIKKVVEDPEVIENEEPDEAEGAFQQVQEENLEDMTGTRAKHKEDNTPNQNEPEDINNNNDGEHKDENQDPQE